MKSWWRFSTDLAMSGLEAQRVVTLRMLKLAAGGRPAVTEANKMVMEKFVASVEAGLTIAKGGSAQKVLRRYRTIMRENERRLSRRKR